jgi:NADPH:quinone reductase-like Zn-dependent oxidoreductase
LGANQVIDFRKQRFDQQVGNVDAVIDLVGGETQTRSFQILRHGGKMISAVSTPDQNLARSSGIEARFFLVNVTSRYLEEIASLADGGHLRARVGAILPFEEAREAHQMLERSRPPAKGKIVLNVGTSETKERDRDKPIRLF